MIMRYWTYLFTLLFAEHLISAANVPLSTGTVQDPLISRRLKKSLQNSPGDCYEIHPKDPYKAPFVICRPETTSSYNSPSIPALASHPASGLYAAHPYSTDLTSYKPPSPPPLASSSPSKPVSYGTPGVVSTVSESASASSSSNHIPSSGYALSTAYLHPTSTGNGYQRADMQSRFNNENPHALMGVADDNSSINQARATDNQQQPLFFMQPNEKAMQQNSEKMDDIAAKSASFYGPMNGALLPSLEHHIYSQNIYQNDGSSVPYVHPPHPVAHSPVTLSCQMHRNPSPEPAAPLAILQLYLKPNQLNLHGANYHQGQYYQNNNHPVITSGNIYRTTNQGNENISAKQNSMMHNAFSDARVPFEEGLGRENDALELTGAKSFENNNQMLIQNPNNKKLLNSREEGTEFGQENSLGTNSTTNKQTMKMESNDKQSNTITFNSNQEKNNSGLKSSEQNDLEKNPSLMGATENQNFIANDKTKNNEKDPLKDNEKISKNEKNLQNIPISNVTMKPDDYQTTLTHEKQKSNLNINSIQKQENKNNDINIHNQQQQQQQPTTEQNNHKQLSEDGLLGTQKQQMKQNQPDNQNFEMKNNIMKGIFRQEQQQQQQRQPFQQSSSSIAFHPQGTFEFSSTGQNPNQEIQGLTPGQMRAEPLEIHNLNPGTRLLSVSI